MIKKARELALFAGETVDPNCIPETYWEQAYQLLCEQDYESIEKR